MLVGASQQWGLVHFGPEYPVLSAKDQASFRFCISHPLSLRQRLTATSEGTFQLMGGQGFYF